MEIDQDNKIVMYVVSNQRLSGTPQNFFIDYDVPRDRSYDSMVVLNASIPKSYYNVPNDIVYFTNQFILIENGVEVTITMTPGNYNIISFMAVLSTLLNAASPNGNTYTLSYPNVLNDTDTGHITYTTSGLQVTKFKLANQYSINVQLGLALNQIDQPDQPTTYTEYTFTAGSLESNNVVNIQPSKSIYICCDKVNDGLYNILQEIPNSATGTMNVLNYQCTTPDAWTKPYLGNRDNLFQFQLLDEFFLPVDTNGLDWSVTILLYKRQTVVRKIKDFIRYVASE